MVLSSVWLTGDQILSTSFDASVRGTVRCWFALLSMPDDQRPTFGLEASPSVQESVKKCSRKTDADYFNLRKKTVFIINILNVSKMPVVRIGKEFDYEHCPSFSLCSPFFFVKSSVLATLLLVFFKCLFM